MLFLAVYRAGSTLEASRDLRMSPPTIGRKIATLEDQLGIKLFERDTRGFHPTSEARVLLAAAEKVEASIREFSMVANEYSRAAALPIRLTAISFNFGEPVTSILTEFAEQNPDTSYEFVATTQLLDLSAGAADVALRVAQEIGDERLICTKLTDAKNTLFASRGYASRNNLPASDEEFEEHTFIAYDGNQIPRLMVDWLSARVASDQIVARCSEGTTMISALKTGAGLGLLPMQMAAEEPDLVACFDPPQELDVPIWLLAAPSAYRRPAVRKFYSYFAEQFRRRIRQ